MVRKIPQVVPWASFEEWKDVSRLLFSDEAAKKARGIDLVIVGIAKVMHDPGIGKLMAGIGEGLATQRECTRCSGSDGCTTRTGLAASVFVREPTKTRLLYGHYSVVPCAPYANRA